MAAVSWLLARALWRLPPSMRLAVALLLTFAAHYALLEADLESFIARHASSRVPWRVVFPAASTLAVACAIALGRVLARGALRWVGVALGVALAVANHLILVLDYSGTHFVLAWGAACLIGASALHWVAERTIPRGVHLALIVSTVLASLSYAIAPGPIVRSALLASSGAVAAPLAARIWARFQGGAGASVREHDPAWFKPRWHLRALPPEILPGAPPAPIVIMLTVDALRPDVIESRQYKRATPNFRAMAKNSLRFSRVWSPAAYTLGSLRAIFSGMHISQSVGRAKSPDPGPEPLPLSFVLKAGGVHTVNLLTHEAFSM